MTSKKPINPPVVAQVPKTGVSTWTPPNPDKNWYSVAKQYNMPQGYIPASADPTGARNKAYLDTFGVDQAAPQVGAVDPFGAGGVQGLLAGIRGSGGGSSTAAADALARDKFNAEQAAAGTASDTALRALQGYQQMLAGGGYRGNSDTLLGLINDQYTQGQSAIQGNYKTGMGNIDAGYNTAQGMIDTGYGDLNKYLNANQGNPYANLQQQVSPVNNAMANYLSAYGVSNDPVNQQVQASQMANQQGADSYNQLQQMMSANQLSNNQSNLGLSQMAQNYATTGLGSQRAGYQANADASRSAAMMALQQQIDAARFGVEQDAGNARTELEKLILGLGGSLDGSMAGSGVDGKTVAPGSATARSKDVASAADNYPNFKAALAAMNPNYKFTTMAAAKKKFPALAGKF